MNLSWFRVSREFPGSFVQSLQLSSFQLTGAALCIAILCSPFTVTSQTSTRVANSSLDGLAAKTTSGPRKTAGRAEGVSTPAVNLLTQAPFVYLPCGTYPVNLVITKSDIRIEGAERGCVQLVPANPALPVVTIDSTNSGQTGIGYDEVSDLTITCPAGMTCSDGLKITGRTDIYQPNDWHRFSRLGIYGNFHNGINLAGRTIWTEFDNIEVELARGNGINIVSSGTTNQLTFRTIRTAHNRGYGVYVNNTQKDLANGILFDKVNVEYNGENTAMANCAGMYLTGISQATVTNSYFEGNCQGNTADKKLAEIRLTGTYNQSVSILNSVFNLQFTENGIYNDTVMTTGTYDGNKFTGSGVNGLTVYVATVHPMSQVLIGDNFSSTPTIVPDENGVSHVRTLSAFGFDYNAITSVPDGTIDVGGKNAAILYDGPYKINSLINGTLGQLVYLTALTKSGHVLTNSAGTIGQFLFSDGQNRTLNAGESLLFYFDGSYWRPIGLSQSTASQTHYVGQIITRSNYPGGPRGEPVTDELLVTDLTSQGHCWYSPGNSAAALMTGTYITTGTGAVMLTHQPVADGEYSIFCSSN